MILITFGEVTKRDSTTAMLYAGARHSLQPGNPDGYLLLTYDYAAYMPYLNNHFSSPAIAFAGLTIYLLFSHLHNKNAFAMIIRPPQHWFRRLFVWHGSVLPKILFRLSLNVLMSVIAVVSFQWYETLGIKLTTAPFSLLGVAIAIFLGFRNNASYARFTEARLLWGSLAITQRSLLRQLQSIFLQQPHYGITFGRMMIAFNWSLKHQLRRSDGRADLARLLPPEMVQQVADSRSPANLLLLKMGRWLGELRQQGQLSDILYQGMDNNLNELSHVLAGCERIAGTPIPFAYSLILHRTVYLFCTLLPFALVADLHYMTPLVSVFVSYTFLSLESLAEELENPFGLYANDLPLNALCSAIEISLKEMNGESPLPAHPQPDKHYNLI